jgi:GAF domain/ANTAR domain
VTRVTTLNSSRGRTATDSGRRSGRDPARPVTPSRIGAATAAQPDPERSRVAATAATVSDLCQECVTDLDASAGVVSLMTRAGYRAAAHATDSRARQLDEDQFTLGEGPTLDAFDTASTVLAVDLRTNPWRTRWPLFVPAAERLSFRAALSFPLLAGARSLGVMTVYGSRPVDIDEQRLTRAKNTADQVTMTLLNAPQATEEGRDGAPADAVPDVRSPDPDDTTSASPAPGDIVVYYRAEIYQASGMIMAQLNCTIDEAMARLRAYAFAHDRPLQEVARQVVDRKVRFEQDG